ncbi:MAG TPA: calcium/proton exchanger [Verrucomicrobiae bacterium]|nr:calcium/proton exchanger [Verrucomicrobiae bacterium]
MSHGDKTGEATDAKAFLKPSIYWLFVFIPITVVLEHAGKLPAPVIFFSAALAIVPIAALIVQATEQVATYTGDAIGGLLNATFGNAPELIIALVALRSGYLDMVRASIVGGVLANLLLALGAAFLLGGLRFHDQKFNPTGARAYSTMMLLAAVSLVVPSAFSRYFSGEDTIRQVKMLNIGIAVLLLLAYGLYLLFSLKTHPKAFASVEQGGSEQHHEGIRWSISRGIGTLLGAAALAAWMSEVLVGAAEGTGKALGMSDVFIGIVFLAIVGGAAESGSAIAVACRNKTDLSVGIALGSSIQIALFVAPVLVLASYFIAPAPLDLSFGRAEVGSLFIAVLLGTVVCGDGQANWYKGVQLLTLYAIFALMFYFMPEIKH